MLIAHACRGAYISSDKEMMPLREEYFLKVFRDALHAYHYFRIKKIYYYNRRMASM